MMANLRLLEEECQTLTRYLINRPAGELVVGRYVHAHACLPLESTEAISHTDQVLLTMARRGGLCTRMADLHAHLLSADGPLRRKLILLIALLEADPVTRPHMDRTNRTSQKVVLIRMVGWGLSSLFLLVISWPWFALKICLIRFSSRNERS